MTDAFFSRIGRLAAAASLVCTPALPVAAQDNGQSLAALCDDEVFLGTCPVTCRSRCAEDDFASAHANLCEGEPDGLARDPPSCARGEVVLTELGACVDKAASIPHRVSPLMTRTEERREFVEAFFSDIPQCARSAVGLRGMYHCLSEEAEIVESEYGSLQGIEIDASDPAQLRDVACELDMAEIDELDLAAIGLDARASELRGELTTVSECRRRYVQWLDDRGTLCQDERFRTFRSCEPLITAQRQDIDVSLKQAEAESAIVDAVISSIEDDLDEVVTVVMYAANSCPRDG